MRSSVRRFLTAGSLCLALAGCSSHDERRADLIIANGAEPETLDPALATVQPDQRLCYALFEGLTTFDAAGQAQPGVAERWDLSPDGVEYTFHLRRDALWSNGERVTARDFVASWRRVLSPRTGSQYAYQLFLVRGAARFNNSEPDVMPFEEVGVRAPDDDTLVVALEHPTPYFLDVCALPTLAPVHSPTVERWGDAWTRPEHLVGNGAYLLDSWRLNDKIRFRKNPRYWDHDRVRLETVDMLPISHANVALNFFASGLCDLILDKGLTPPALIGDLRTKPYFHAAPFLGSYFLRFNCTRKPFDDARVRQAFSLVIDKELLVNKITKAGERAAYSFVPPGTAGYQPPAPGLGYNPARARELLAAAGYPGGAGFPPVAYIYNEGEQNQYIGVELKSMFERELGVSMTLSPHENKVYSSMMKRLDYDFGRSVWVGDYPDPNTFLEMWLAGSGNNRTGWSDGRYDDLLAQAARATARERRLDLFQQAESLLVSEGTPICPLYEYVGVELYDGERLGGVQPNLLDVHPLRAMYLKTAR